MIYRSSRHLRRPLARIQHRRITGWVSDVLQTKSLFPSNPLLDCVDQRREQPKQPSTGPTSLPDFSRLRPHHLSEAASVFQKEYQTSLEDLEVIAQTSTESATAGSRSDAKALQKLVQQYDATQAPILELKNLSSLCQLLLGSKTWQEPVDQVWTRLELRQETLPYIPLALKTLFSSVDKNQIEKDILWAAQHLVRSHEQRLGSTIDDPVAREQFQTYGQALEQVEGHLRSNQSDSLGELIKDIYTVVGLQTERAKLLGYTNCAEQALERRMLGVEEVRQLHQTVSERVLPHCPRHATISSDEIALDELLSRSGSSNANASVGTDPLQNDERTMFRMEEYVTLDGALEFVFRLSNDLLGITIFEDTEYKQGWNKDVRLFHVFEDVELSDYVGSFFLDPFARPEKLNRDVTMPIYARGDKTSPVVCVSLNLEPPTWNTDPAKMTWANMESLLHELGHVYQFLLCPSTIGSAMSPLHMPLDLIEFLPKFMEHWLMERSTLYALMEDSKTDVLFSEESIDAAYRVRSRQKALELAQLTFYGALEMELFSNFDPKGSESMLDLQYRMAESFSPHDVPGKKNPAPLLQIMQENANGRNVGQYRYLYCDVISAMVFDQVKSAYASDASKMQDIHRKFRQVLLNPGAAINVEAFTKEFDTGELSLDPLFDRYRLS